MPPDPRERAGTGTGSSTKGGVRLLASELRLARGTNLMRIERNFIISNILEIHILNGFSLREL